MKRYLKLSLIIILTLTVFLAFPSYVYADDGAPKGDQIIFGKSFVLESDEMLDGNLAVFAGTVTLKDGATVTGDVFVAGGAVWVYGEVDGSVITMGGGAYISKDAVISGDVVVLGGGLNKEDGATIKGEVISSLPDGAEVFGPPVLFRSQMPQFWVDFNPLWNIPKGLFESLIWAVMGALLVLFLPVPTERVSKAIVSKPVLSAGFGLLTMIVLPFILLIFLITLILIPVMPLLLLVLVFALIFGWIASGYEVGRRIAELFRVQWAMPVSAGVGILILTIVAKAIGSIECIGWIVPFVIVMLGLGGVIITRFGSRDHPSDENIQKNNRSTLSSAQPIPSAHSLSTAESSIEIRKTPESSEEITPDVAILQNSIEGEGIIKQVKTSNIIEAPSAVDENLLSSPKKNEEAPEESDEKKPTLSKKSSTSRKKQTPPKKE